MKLKIAILYGGPSNEHEVSINSAQNVLMNIDKERFDVVEIFISKEGMCNLEGEELKIEEVIFRLKNKCDIVFPVLHGTFGEDGKLQKLLEQEQISFVGSGSDASSKAIDKHISNMLFQKVGLLIPQSQIITKESVLTINFPIIVKPVLEGSSLGLFKCDSLDEYKNNSTQIFSTYSEMLAQEFVTGREFTCGIIEIEKREVALPVSEIILKSTGLFDYETKYTAGACSEITPAQIKDSLKEKIQDTALKCHNILGCKSISRTDVIVIAEEKIYVLETNTLPGMTKTSFIPAQAEAFGLSMRELTSVLLDSVR